jgi:hypothetical protein
MKSDMYAMQTPYSLTNHHLTLNNEAFRKFYGRVPLESAFLFISIKGIAELIHKLKYKGHEDRLF